MEKTLENYCNGFRGERERDKEIEATFRLQFVTLELDFKEWIFIWPKLGFYK